MSKKPASRKYRNILAITLALLSVLFFTGGPEYTSPRSFQATWNLGHIIFFALLPLLIFSLSRIKEYRPAVQAAIILGLALVLGVLVEHFQHGFSRTPDMGDLFRNMIGALIAIFFLLPTQKTMSGKALLIFRTTTIILVVAQFYPIVIALLDEYHARRDFPILSDFQTPFQIQRWQQSETVSIRHLPNHPDNQALKADLTTDRFAGASLQHFPRNWQNYQWLQFRVYNPSTESITLTCRIHDKKHTQGIQRYQDRFNQTDLISQGWNTITISLKNVRQAPLNRPMDLSRIYGFGIFATNLPHPRTIYIDDIKLFE